MEPQKVLVVVHTATQNPGQTREGWLKTMVGDETTGDMGRMLHALALCRLLDTEVKLYMPVAPNELPQNTSNIGPPVVLTHTMYLLRACREVFGLNPIAANHCEALVEQGFVDWWDDVPENQVNTNGEAARAVAYAKEHGFDAIWPVSTGYGHTPRVVQTDYVAARKAGIMVLGCADTPFEGLDGEVAAIIDPPHLANAPFAQVKPEWLLHVLLPALFMTFRGDTARYQAFIPELVALMKTHGIEKNAKGQAI